MFIRLRPHILKKDYAGDRSFFVILQSESVVLIMDMYKVKGHLAMLGANVMWGLWLVTISKVKSPE